MANTPALPSISTKSPGFAIVVGAPACGGSYVSVMFDAVAMMRIDSTLPVGSVSTAGDVDDVALAERVDAGNIDSSRWSHAPTPAGTSAQ